MTTSTPHDDPAARVWAFRTDGVRRASDVFRAATARPNWVVRATVLAFLIVISVPVLLLLLVATVIAATVYVVAAGAARIGSLFRGDGRRNVRVIQRYEE